MDPNGQAARVHARWPDFKMAPGLSSRATLTRTEVLARTVDAINERS